MKALVGEPSTRPSDTGVPSISTKAKLLAVLEVLAVYSVVQVLLIFWTSTGIFSVGNGKSRLVLHRHVDPGGHPCSCRVAGAPELGGGWRLGGGLED